MAEHVSSATTVTARSTVSVLPQTTPRGVRIADAGVRASSTRTRLPSNILEAPVASTSHGASNNVDYEEGHMDEEELVQGVMQSFKHILFTIIKYSKKDCTKA